MIEFVTLFLMLTWGVRPVEVAVGGAVAAVELELDGEAVGRLEGEPWSLEVDFGQALRPHVLEATALDGDGRPLAKARQTINFGRSAAEASLILDLDQGAAQRARVVWQTFDHSRPKKMRVRFDGRKVAVAEDGTIDLPAHDPLEPHLLEAKLTFPGSLVAEAELSFGGAYSETLASELTAVPVVFPAGTDPPRPAKMAGWFAAAGEPVRVFSVEQEPGVVFLVRDYNLPSPLPRATPVPVPSGAPMPASAPRKVSPHDLLFIATTPYVTQSAGRPTAIFLIAGVEEAWSRRGLFETAMYLAPQERQRRKQQLFEAIALAGRAAAASARPRAVVLLLDPGSADHSRLSVPQTLDYLRSLRVPLVVWRSPQNKPASFAGGALDALGSDDLEEVVARVDASLVGQHVVWLEGPFLPHQIEITDAAPDGVRFPF